MARNRIAIVEDMTTFRELLAEVLAAHGRYELVAQASSGEEALEVLSRDLPDILVLDFVLPDMSGLELLEKLGSRARRTRVLLVTAAVRPAVVQQALRAGVHGIVSKGTSLRELMTALDAVAANGSYYCASIAKILRAVAQQPAAHSGELSVRERQIVRLIAQGLSSKEIADRLGLSVKTVSNHRTNVMTKIGARNAAAVTRYAIDQGLVDA